MPSGGGAERIGGPAVVARDRRAHLLVAGLVVGVAIAFPHAKQYDSWTGREHSAPASAACLAALGLVVSGLMTLLHLVGELRKNHAIARCSTNLQPVDGLEDDRRTGDQRFSSRAFRTSCACPASAATPSATAGLMPRSEPICDSRKRREPEVHRWPRWLETLRDDCSRPWPSPGAWRPTTDCRDGPWAERIRRVQGA